MAILSWGKPTIEFCPSVGGNPDGSWKKTATPKEDTTKLSQNPGEEKTATEEGGEVVDSRVGKSAFTFEFDHFVKKGEEPFVEDEDGVIAGEFAFRLTPEDEGGKGFLIERATLRCEQTYSSAEGILLHYVAKALKPATGKIIKPYQKNAITLSGDKLYFGAAADNTGKTITATSRGNIAVSTPNSDWITATANAKVATIKVAANTTGKVRVGKVTITADGLASVVEVTQIP